MIPGTETLRKTPNFVRPMIKSQELATLHSVHVKDQLNHRQRLKECLKLDC